MIHRLLDQEQILTRAPGFGPGRFFCAQFSLSRLCARAYPLTDRHNTPLPMRPPDRTPLGSQPWEKNFPSLSFLNCLVRTRMPWWCGAGESDLPGFPIRRNNAQ